jgi:RNA polymerase sigma factor (sigma-70 family)
VERVTIDTGDERVTTDFIARREGGLEQVYRLYGKTLFSTARSVLGNIDDAQDCVHDALLRIWQRPSVFRPERGALRAYLIVAVRNEAITRKRSATRHLALEERSAMAERQEYETDVHDHVELARVRQAVEALPVEQRTALRLAYYGHLSQREIAAATGVPLGTIKSRLVLALRKLQAAVR